MTVESFDRRLAQLSKDYELVDEEQVVAMLDGAEPSRRACWITFDDGYADVLEYAAPVAAKYGISPSIFVTTRALEGDWWPPVDRWYALLRAAERGHFDVSVGGVGETWDLRTESGRARPVVGAAKTSFLESSPDEQEQQLRELATALQLRDVSATPSPFLSSSDLERLSSLGWYVGPHGHEHRLLTRIGRGCLERELLESIKVLDRLSLRRSSRWFAYADGRYNDNVRRNVEQLLAPHGYKGALTIDREIATRFRDSWSMPRFIAEI